jgi:hypothetical protein
MYDVPSTTRPLTLAERIEYIALPVLGVLLTLVSALAVERYAYLWGSDRAMVHIMGTPGHLYNLNRYSVLLGLVIGVSHLVLLRGIPWWAKCVWIAAFIGGVSVANWTMEHIIYEQWKTHTLPRRAIAWVPASQALLWSVGIILVPQVMVGALYRRRHLWWIMVGTSVGWVLVWLILATLFQERMRLTQIFS